MKTAKELKYKFDRDMEELQANCEHEEPSEWIDVMWAPGHYTDYRIKECPICGKVLFKMKTCEGCSKTYVINVDEEDIFDCLCEKCKKKGKYYCSHHRKFYDKKCPECEKFEKMCEEDELQRK